MADRKALVERINKNFVALKKRRAPFEPVIDELFANFLPRLSPLNNDNAEGENRSQKLLNQTPMESLKIASAGYQGWLFPRSQPWDKINFENEDIAQLPEARKYCQALEKYVNGELRRGGFYKQAAEWTDIGLGVCTTIMFVGENKKKSVTKYLTLHPKECYLAFDSEGEPDTLYREYPVTGRQILQEWPKAELSDKARETLEKGEYEKFKVLWAVGPRTDRDFNKIDTENKPFYSVYLLKDIGDEVLDISGFDDFPFVVWRPRTTTDEDMGRGPGWDQLSTAKRLQAVSRSSTKGIQLGIQSPLQVPADMIDSLDLTPWGINPYKGELKQIRPILSSVAIEPALKKEADLEQQIRDGFDNAFFMMMMANRKGDRTATEIYEMAGERSVVMGTMVGSCEDSLSRIIDLTLKNGKTYGRLPQIPASLANKPTAQLKYEFIGPLANLQRRYHGQQATMQTLAQAAIILKMDPQSGFVVNFQKTMRKFLDASGFDADCINDDKTVQEKIAAAAKAQQTAMMMEMMEKMGKAAPALQGMSANQEEGAEARSA